MATWLQETTWIRLLPEVARQRVLAEAYEASHAERELVARKGEPANSWIGVVDGLLKASGSFRSGKSLIFSSVPAGSWVGEGSVLKREPRHYDLVAVQPSRTVHIPRATFRWLLDTSLDFNHLSWTTSTKGSASSWAWSRPTASTIRWSSLRAPS